MQIKRTGTSWVTTSSNVKNLYWGYSSDYESALGFCNKIGFGSISFFLDEEVTRVGSVLMLIEEQ